MFRYQIFLALILSLFITSCGGFKSRKPASVEPQVYMSPHEGKDSFEKIYGLVKGAKNYVHMSLYSWSDAGLKNALAETLSKEKPPKVRIVLHKDLWFKKGGPKSSLKAWVEELEKLGAEFKSAKGKNHEKFLIVDDEMLMNGSANMSSGPLSRYSENMVYYGATKKKSHAYNKLIEQFKHEFAIIFNSGIEITTHGEKNAEEVEGYIQFDDKGIPTNNIYKESELYLVSSSMNFKVRRNKPTSKSFKEGRILSLGSKKDGSSRTWRVREMLIREIDKAKDNMLICLNHLTLPKVKDAIVRAVKRGVKVNWVADNNEYKNKVKTRGGKLISEQTPHFVEEYKKIKKVKEAPVRVKWYSVTPNPGYALLNHHKFILIDHGTANPVLLSGSSNMSKTAEHNQFDNIVVHRGDQYNSLNQAFADEFWNLWNLNRNDKDKPDAKLLKKFVTVDRKGNMAIHKKTPISLTWDEVAKLNKDIKDAAPGLSSGLWGHGHCAYYNVKKKQYLDRSFKVCPEK